MAPEPLSTAYFINPSHQSLCLYAYPHLSLLGNSSVDTFHVNEYTQQYKNYWRHNFVYSPCCIKGESVYPLIIARQWLGKHIPAAMNNCWRHSFLRSPCRIKGKQGFSSSQNFLFVYFVSLSLVHMHTHTHTHKTTQIL
jgi:hypothetical protein